MNHNGLKLARELKTKGLLEDSEEVWVSFVPTPRKDKIVKRESYEMHRIACQEIGPAGNCEELGDLLFTLDLKLVRVFKESYLLKWRKADNRKVRILEHIKAKNETEAREKALLWYFKQKEE